MKRVLSVMVVFMAVFSFSLMGSVTHIWPESGINEDTTSAHIFGSGFTGTPTVKLERTGSPEITATNVNVASPNYLTCDFNLSGAESGLYSLVVDTDTLRACFTIHMKVDTPFVWVTTDMGSASNGMRDVAIGDGNNDGELEVYGANLDHHIYQLKWDGTTWDKTDMGSGGNSMSGVSIGDGNNDGELEVYGANQDHHIYQFKWNGSGWDKSDIGAGTDIMRGVCVGDGNNNGAFEVYGACRNGHMYQFKWNGTTWDRTDMGSIGFNMFSAAVGDGNNDGELEVYGTNDNGHMYQFKWNGSTWDISDMGNSGTNDMQRVAVGDGNNDGEFEVYGTNQDHHMYQFKWNGTTWDMTDMGSGVNEMIGVYVGDGNNDGLLEVYGANRDHHIYQFKWDGTTWDKTDMGSGGNYMDGAAVGDGNNDGLLEVYGANYDNHIYQFRATPIPTVTHIWPESGIDEDTTSAHIFGSGFTGTPTVKLERTGSPEITATNVNVASSNYLTCDFDLTGANLGLYSLIVETDTLRACFTVNSRVVPPFVWDTTDMGSGGSYMYGAAVGDGNNDGELEVYVGNADHHIYQFKWDGATWDTTDMGSGGSQMFEIAVGDGNNDGELEVYGTNDDYHIYQFKWDGATWDKTDMGSGGTNMYGVAIGDGNNDGELEVYSSNADHHIYQFKWNGISWDKTDMGSGGNRMHRVAVGDGNNDGELEVYGANLDHHIYQFKWNGTTWDKTDMGSGGNYMSGVAVGDGNNDGLLEVYGANYDYHIYQFKWNGTTWDTTDMGSGGNYMYGVAVGDGNNDGLLEVYGTNFDHHIYQFKWDGATWDTTDMGSGGNYMYGAAVGDGNNDGLLEVYGANYDNHIYQFRAMKYQNIVLSDTAYNFGNVQPGDSALWQYLYIENTGELVLHIDSIISSNTVFSVLNTLPDSISPGDSTGFTVQFKPLAEEVYQGTLSVYSDDPDDSLLFVYLSGISDTTNPLIDSTTIWTDTLYAGPFEIRTKVTDDVSGLDSILLYYMRDEDPNWITEVMYQSGNWFIDTIPAVGNSNDTVRYYIRAVDIVGNTSSDPVGAPTIYYSFIANVAGIDDSSDVPQVFWLSVNTLVKGTAVFRFGIPEKCNLRLEVYDVTGRLVSAPLSGEYSKGYHNISFNPKTKGIYFYRLNSKYGNRRGKIVIF